MSIEKVKQYQREFKPHLQLINGLELFLKRSKEAGIQMAIGSAAIQSNIDFVLDGLHIRNYFDVLVSADDVKHSKPDPETYIKCAGKLGIAAKNCLVFEDAPKGAESAKNAGMDCIIITTSHYREEFNHINNVVRIIKDYNKFTLS
jgi:beta-phosphoglucomutase